MASFIPYHGKKRDRLHRLESDLVRLLSRGASESALLRVAFAIRECRIGVLRAKQNLNPQRNLRERAAVLRLADRIAELRATPLESILNEFRTT